MKWKETMLGHWFDAKVRELDFPQTIAMFGKWKNHSKNLNIFKEKEIPVYWVANASSPYTFDYTPYYFVPVFSEEEMDNILKNFVEDFDLYYARCYDGDKAYKSFYHKSK